MARKREPMNVFGETRDDLIARLSRELAWARASIATVEAERDGFRAQLIQLRSGANPEWEGHSGGCAAVALGEACDCGSKP